MRAVFFQRRDDVAGPAPGASRTRSPFFFLPPAEGRFLNSADPFPCASTFFFQRSRRFEAGRVAGPNIHSVAFLGFAFRAGSMVSGRGRGVVGPWTPRLTSPSPRLSPVRSRSRRATFPFLARSGFGGSSSRHPLRGEGAIRSSPFSLGFFMSNSASLCRRGQRLLIARAFFPGQFPAASRRAGPHLSPGC